MKTYRDKLHKDHIVHSYRSLYKAYYAAKFLKNVTVRNQLYDTACLLRNIERDLATIFEIEEPIKENEQPKNIWRRNN